MSDARPKIIAIAGPNGAGKSTLAPFLLRDIFGLTEYVNADTIALGLSAFNPAGVAFESGRVMLKRLHTLAEARADFAFETTLATRSYAGWIADLRRRQGYEFHLIYLWLHGAELAVWRVEERVRLGGHHVPAHIIRRRYVKGLRNFFALYRVLADTWGIYDNSVVGELPRIATGIRDESEQVFQEKKWRRFCETIT